MKPEPIRVLRLITRLNIGGPAREVEALCRGAETFGCRTVLAAGAASPEEGDLFDVLDLGSTERVRIPGLCRNPGLWREFKAAAFLHRLIQKFRPHVVHTHTSKAGLLGRLVAAANMVPVLCHTYHGHVFRGHFSPAWSRVVVDLERVLGRLTDAVVVLGPEAVRDLNQLGIGRRVVAIAPGFDPARLAAFRCGGREAGRHRWGIPGNERAILVLGRLAPVKGIDVLIDILADLAAHGVRPHVLVAGDGPQRADLEKQTRRLGLAGTVRFLGWLDDVSSVLAAADLLVMPSRSEGYPHVLMEAQAAGLPVLATDVGEVKHLIDHGQTGFLIPPDDPGALADSLRRLLTEPSRLAPVRNRLAACTSLGSCANEMVERTVALYSELLAR